MSLTVCRWRKNYSSDGKRTRDLSIKFWVLYRLYTYLIQQFASHYYASFNDEVQTFQWSSHHLSYLLRETEHLLIFSDQFLFLLAFLFSFVYFDFPLKTGDTNPFVHSWTNSVETSAGNIDDSLTTDQVNSGITSGSSKPNFLFG